MGASTGKIFAVAQAATGSWREIYVALPFLSNVKIFEVIRIAPSERIVRGGGIGWSSACIVLTRRPKNAQGSQYRLR